MHALKWPIISARIVPQDEEGYCGRSFGFALPGGRPRVHRGFFRAYQTVAPRLHETLRQFWRESPAVFAPAGRGAELIFVGELTVDYAGILVYSCYGLFPYNP